MKSHVKGREDLNLLERTIPEIQEQVTEKFKNKEFLVSIPQKVRLTFKEFNELTDRTAKGLISLGVQQEDRVGIAMANSVEWLAAFFALFKIGAYPVNIVPTLPTKDLKYMIKQPELKCLIGDKRNLEMVDPDRYPFLKKTVSEEEWEEMLRSGEKISEAQLESRKCSLNTGNIAGLCYTSGTTGQRKGVILTHYNLVNNVNILAYCCGYSNEEVISLSVPMFHFFGWVLSILAMHQGMKLVLPTSYVRPESILECLEKEKCTTMGSAPQIFNFFVNFPELGEFDLSLRHCFVGSDVLSGELIEAMYSQLGIDNLQNVWGSTELGGAFTISPLGTPKEKLTSIGKVIPRSELKVVDPETGQTLPRGEQGEIWGKGPSIFKGYWQKDKETKATLKEEWVRTGDMGFIDREGFVHFKGRADDIFKKGAKKVAPAPIEATLKQHREIIDAGVVPVPDEKYGSEVAAFIQVKEEVLSQIEKSRAKAKQLKQDLRKLARKKLEPFKVPKYVKFVKELPRTATGKIKHFILKEQANLVNS